MQPHEPARDRPLDATLATPPPGSLAPAVGVPRPGQRLGGYVVARELGRGAMGAVFVARHVGLDRDVALKVLLEADPIGLARFLREGRAAARLRHPAIVAVHDVGEAGGLPYLCMDLVPGGSLEQRLRQGPLEPAAVVRLGVTLAGALAHAHEQGVLHRDLKPANVLLTPAGEALLTDFGIAKDARDARALTGTGDVLGTPAYMAPEQADGATRHADGRTDVYGLGATLYEALTGRPPFAAPGLASLLRLVLEAPPAPPSALRPGVPPALEAVLLRCLEKDPARRPASARDLQRELEALERAAAVASPAPAAPAERRGAVVAAAVAGAVALAACAAAVAVILARSPAAGTPAEAPPAVVAPTAPAPPPTAPAPSPSPSAPLDPVAAPPLDPALERWAWGEAAPATSPSPRLGVDGAAAFDEGRGVVVLVGGWSGDAARGDTWTWSGGDWRQAEDFPGGDRYSHGVAWDPAGRRLLVFGGTGTDRRPRTALWARGDDGWAQLEQAGPAPGPRSSSSLAYDPDRRALLVFGGLLDGRTPAQDLWAWDGTRWALLDAGSGPSPRSAASAIYDAPRRALVLVGGASGRRYLDDLWLWQDGAWRPGPRGPDGRANPALAHDGRRVLLFGGGGPATGTTSEWVARGDTWTWDGERWSELETDRRPPARSRAALVWDPRRRAAVLFGGCRAGAALGDTWELRPVEPR